MLQQGRLSSIFSCTAGTGPGMRARAFFRLFPLADFVHSTILRTDDSVHTAYASRIALIKIKELPFGTPVAKTWVHILCVH